jgi:NADP-dependent 3-hydroxy acid dehydrogenase YdfG
MKDNIAGKIVVITGASGGLREATARLLSAEGAVATELPNTVTDPDVAPRIQKLYEDVAIPADSFARAVVFAMSQPDDVAINEILFRPTKQEY